MKKFKKLGAMLLAVTMLAGLSSKPAYAENVSLPDATGSLTIHKYLMDDVDDAGLPNDGNEVPDNELPAGATPLKDVTFAIYQIDVTYDANGNLTSPVTFPKDAEEAEQMLADGDLTMTFVANVTTGADGTVKKEGLKGYYYVKEISSDHTQVATFSAPFLVSVPMTDPTDLNKWITDVHVYPKNAPLNTTKTVDNGKFVTGEYYGDNQVSWQINTNIPNNIADAAASIDSGNGGYYRIVDYLDVSFNFLTTPTLEVYAGSSKGDKTITLVKDTDYKLYTGERTDGSGTTVTVDLTKVGMEKLANSGTPYKNLFIEFYTSLKEGAKQNEMIFNNAETYFSADPDGDPGTPEDPDDPTPDPDNPPTPSEPSEEDKPYVIVGKLGFVKVQEDGSTALEGAKFKISATEADAKAGTYLQYTKSDGTKADITAVSDGSGNVVFKNLNLTPEFDAAGEFTGFAEEAYWLVEVEAPNGYNLLTNPVKIEVLDTIAETGSHAYEVVFKAGNDNINDGSYKVVNTKGFTLPSTGGTGTILFTIGGIALIGAAVILLIMSQKKRTNNTAK